jgi:VIT1/CCC1 family predicted Fe2+/Mn2+ transporter
MEAAFGAKKGALMVLENETLANLTANASGILTSTLANETVKQAATNAGNFGLDKLLNMQWTDGIAAWISQTTGFSVSGSVIAALLPIITILFLYWKWNAIVQFIQTAGQVILVLLIFFLVLKAFGIL